MDNYSMLYAYSSKEQVFHDRDCPYVREIPDDEFCMTAQFMGKMVRCPECYKRAVIRYGIGYDRRRISDYERFFDRMMVNQTGLYLLFIVHKAKVKWVNCNTLEVCVRSDTWRVIHYCDKVELWHNNYWRLENATRSIESKFHLQHSCDIEYAWTLFKLICTYSYDKFHTAESENSVVVVD